MSQRNLSTYSVNHILFLDSTTFFGYISIGRFRKLSNKLSILTSVKCPRFCLQSQPRWQGTKTGTNNKTSYCPQPRTNSKSHHRQKMFEYGIWGQKLRHICQINSQSRGFSKWVVSISWPSSRTLSCFVFDFMAFS